MVSLVAKRQRPMQGVLKALGKSRHSRPLVAPAIMIAVARSGNNNLCHIVTPRHGERPVPATRLRSDASLHPEPRAARPREGVQACLIHNILDSKPVPIGADFARHYFIFFPSRIVEDAVACALNPSLASPWSRRFRR